MRLDQLVVSVLFGALLSSSATAGVYPIEVSVRETAPGELVLWWIGDEAVALDFGFVGTLTVTGITPVPGVENVGKLEAPQFRVSGGGGLAYNQAFATLEVEEPDSGTLCIVESPTTGRLCWQLAFDPTWYQCDVQSWMGAGAPAPCAAAAPDPGCEPRVVSVDSSSWGWVKASYR